MSLIKRITQLEERVQELYDLIVGPPEKRHAFDGLDEEEGDIDGDEDESVLEEDDSTCIIGAYHKANKSRRCIYFWTGPDHGWNTDPEDALEFDDEQSARKALKSIDPPKAAFRCIILPCM